MGWRTDEAYDDDRREDLRSLPLRQRYNWPLILVLLGSSAAGAALGFLLR